MKEKVLFLSDEQMTLLFATKLALACTKGGIIYLLGDLGVGKTTLCRGIVHALGYQGAVKSPTYTLVESYELPSITVHHFDLYRLADAEELEYMGIRDYFQPSVLCLCEWPQHGEGVLPSPDLKLYLSHHENGRKIRLVACSSYGETLYSQLTQ